MAFSLNSPPTPTDIGGVVQILPVLVQDVLREQLKLDFAVAEGAMLAAGAVWERWGCSGSAGEVSKQLGTIWRAALPRARLISGVL